MRLENNSSKVNVQHRHQQNFYLQKAKALTAHVCPPNPSQQLLQFHTMDLSLTPAPLPRLWRTFSTCLF